MRQIKMKKMINFIRSVVFSNINNFFSDGKRGYASLEYAIGFIVMYSISFLDNVLLNKPMPKVAFRIYESIFIYFSSKIKRFDPAIRKGLFISKAKVRGLTVKKPYKKSGLLIYVGVA